jgi:uncharacterized protein (TIGR02466 family)
MATTDLYPLFSTPVLTVDSEVPKFQSTINYCENVLEYRVNSGGNSTSKHSKVLDLPELKEIKELCEQAVDYYARNVAMMDLTDVTPYITQSWINKNSKGTSHHEHFHNNSLFSGVFYLQTAENDHITFNSGTRPFLNYKETEHNIWNSRAYHVPVKDNRIIIFPSQTLHTVGSHLSQWDRISLAFNVFIKGQLGVEDNLTLLTL